METAEQEQQQRQRLEAAQQAIVDMQRELDADPARVELARQHYVVACAEVERLNRKEIDDRRKMVQTMAHELWGRLVKSGKGD